MSFDPIQIALKGLFEGSAASGEGVLTTKPFRKNVAFPATVFNSTVGVRAICNPLSREAFSVRSRVTGGYVYRGIFLHMLGNAWRSIQQMDRAVKGLVTGRYQWIAFTSVNAVRAIREKFEEYGLDARAFAGVKVAAVGEQTAASLRAFGITPELVPDGEQSGEGLAAGV